MLGPAACRGSYGSAPAGALRRQPLDGASGLAGGQAPCSLTWEFAGQPRDQLLLTASPGGPSVALETAVTSCASANGFASITLPGTPLEAHSWELPPLT